MSTLTAEALARAFDRTFELPHSEPRVVVLRALVLRVGSTRVLAPLADVVEVRRLGPLAAVPSALDGLLGLTAFRGELVLVLDAGAALGLGPGERECLVLVTLDAHTRGATIGLAVDAIEGLAGLEAGDVLTTTGSSSATPSTRLGRVGEDALPILDISTIKERVTAPRRSL